MIATTSNESVEDSDLVLKLRENFYADRRWFLVVILILQLTLLSGIIGYMVLKLNSKPKPIFFPTTSLGQLIEPVPLDRPSMEQAALLNWLMEAVISAYSFNYMNLENHPKRLSAYFDERGYKQFMEILTTDQNMRVVLKDRLIVSGVAAAAPELLKNDVVRGRYVWMVKIPLNIRYMNKMILRRQRVEITVFAIRVPETDNPLGVRITSILAKVLSETQPTANLQVK